VICAGALSMGCAPKGEEKETPEPIAIHCVTAKLQSVDLAVTLRGRVAPPPGRDLPISSQVPGRIVSVKVAEGTRVSAGALIAEVDDATSRDALREAQASVSRARASARNAEATLARVRTLVERGIAASQELDDAVAAADREKADVHAAEAAASSARVTLGRVKIKAPFGGSVTRVWRGPGALVDGTAGTPIVQIASSELELALDATSEELAGVQSGQKVAVELDAERRHLTGVVRARPEALDPASGLGVVRVQLANAEPPPMVGSFGVGVIDEGRKASALVVPASALRGAVSDGAELVVCKDGKADIRTVTTGFRDGKLVEVLSGLKAGERVAVDRVLGLEQDYPLADAP